MMGKSPVKEKIPTSFPEGGMRPMAAHWKDSSGSGTVPVSARAVSFLEPRQRLHLSRRSGDEPAAIFPYQSAWFRKVSSVFSPLPSSLFCSGV